MIFSILGLGSILESKQYLTIFLHIKSSRRQVMVYQLAIQIVVHNIKLYVKTFSKPHFWYLGKKEVLMSVKDFYNAVTPGSSLTHGVGRGVYTILGKDDICSATTYGHEKLPVESKGRPSLLNEVHFILQYSTSS